MSTEQGEHRKLPLPDTMEDTFRRVQALKEKTQSLKQSYKSLHEKVNTLIALQSIPKTCKAEHNYNEELERELYLQHQRQVMHEYAAWLNS